MLPFFSSFASFPFRSSSLALSLRVLYRRAAHFCFFFLFSARLFVRARNKHCAAAIMIYLEQRDDPRIFKDYWVTRAKDYQVLFVSLRGTVVRWLAFFKPVNLPSPHFPCFSSTTQCSRDCWNVPWYIMQSRIIFASALSLQRIRYYSVIIRE